MDFGRLLSEWDGKSKNRILKWNVERERKKADYLCWIALAIGQQLKIKNRYENIAYCLVFLRFKRVMTTTLRILMDFSPTLCGSSHWKPEPGLSETFESLDFKNDRFMYISFQRAISFSNAGACAWRKEKKWSMKNVHSTDGINTVKKYEWFLLLCIDIVNVFVVLFYPIFLLDIFEAQYQCPIPYIFCG